MTHRPLNKCEEVIYFQEKTDDEKFWKFKKYFQFTNYLTNM